jgi:acyl carrier protein
MDDAEKRQAEIERWVIETCQALKLPIGTADDDIFDAGATSLTVVRLVAKAESEFGAEVLSPDDIVESSSVLNIAASIRRNMTDTAASATDRV